MNVYRALSQLLIALCFTTLVACVPIQPEASTTTNDAPLPGVPASNTTQQPVSAQPGTEQAPAPASTNADLTPQVALARLFTEPLQPEESFASEFLNQVPADQIAELLTQITEQFGAFQQVEGEANPFTVVFELGTVPAEISLSEDGKIVGLFFSSGTRNVASLDEALAMVDELQGEVSVLVVKNGEETAALNADTPLGVGSAFKLAVLLILRGQIEAGLHTWDEVVPLAAEWKAPPSSLLTDWPDDSPVTLHTLATLMISLSDNTAADALVHIVGREQVETISPHNRPLLTVQELFKLKTTTHADLLATYREGDEAARRQVLDTLATAPLPALDAASPLPILDVEWFFSARELCDIMAQVEDLDLMTVSPGPATSQPDSWARIAFKGGSELGVLNLTTWLESETGDTYCVTMTQNNPDAAINEDEFISLYRTVVSVME